MRNNIELLPSLITPRVALALIPAFTSAYAMAIEVADAIDFLRGDLRSQIIPHLKNWAVEFELKRRSDEGSIPFWCNVTMNERKNHKHIELHTDKWILTVSQVHTPMYLPREALYRNELNLDGQIALEGFDSEDSTDGEIYAILTHGWQTNNPAFINCGILSPNGTCWVQQMDVLNAAQRMTVLDVSPVTENIKLEFREQAIEKI